MNCLEQMRLSHAAGTVKEHGTILPQLLHDRLRRTTSELVAFANRKLLEGGVGANAPRVGTGGLLLATGAAGGAAPGYR